MEKQKPEAVLILLIPRWATDDSAIHTESETKKGKTEEWHYYISSQRLTAAELLHHARMEWTVETMHWLLNPYFISDFLEN